MDALPPLVPFDGRVIDLLDDLSRRLRGTREWPDAAAFGFWCRRASLIEQKAALGDLSNRLGRGTALHIAPSNVPLNFAYSLAAGLLAGNACAVRLPSRKFPQVDALCAALEELLAGGHARLAPYICCLRYGHEREINDMLSSMSDVRVIWGGDATIAEIRRSPARPRAADICFADRWSLAVIDADAYLVHDGKASLARGFCNDTYLTDQLACTAPCLVFWTGEAVGAAREAFWSALRPLVERDYPVAAAQAVAKREAFCRLAAQWPGARLEPGDNHITRVWLPSLAGGRAADWRVGGGFFLEAAGGLAEALAATDRACQTLSYFGFTGERLRDALLNARPAGVDRVVPIGRAMDFSFIWDGTDLIRGMSREITAL